MLLLFVRKICYYYVLQQCLFFIYTYILIIFKTGKYFIVVFFIDKDFSVVAM